MIHLQVVTASVRPVRRGAAIAQWAAGVIEKDERFAVEPVDLAEVNLPLFDEPRHPRFGNYQHEHTRRWSEIVSRADAFVFVTPEYNNTMPASLKNALDFLSNEWRHKPAGFVAYGGASAGTRAVVSLRPVLAALNMLQINASVLIPFFEKMMHSDGHFTPNEGLEESFKPMLDGIAFFVEKIGPQGKRP